jgi:hypothetical protein
MSLIPCPWCANDGDRGIASDERFDAWGAPAIVWFVECECGARGPSAESPAQAEELWNKRSFIPGIYLPGVPESKEPKE